MPVSRSWAESMLSANIGPGSQMASIRGGKNPFEDSLQKSENRQSVFAVLRAQPHRPLQTNHLALLMKTALFFTTLAILAFLSSCSSSTHRTSLIEANIVNEGGFSSVKQRSNYSYWSDRVSNAPLRITIKLSDQTAYFHRGGEKVGQSRVATGKQGHSTPLGSFTISEKVVDKRSTLYGRIYDAKGYLKIADAHTRRHTVPEGGKFVGCPMPYWMRLTGSGIGMHVGPIPNPGAPASHGCIRMPREMARGLFDKAPVGTKVTIVH